MVATLNHRLDRSLPIEERFDAKYVPDPTTGCWLWTAAVQRNNGYARFGFGGGRVGFAHRWSYQHHIGPVPEGLNVLHRCDTPSCVRPDHLFVGTQGENIRDCVAKGRHVPYRGSQP